jgi:hypothetical protein
MAVGSLTASFRVPKPWLETVKGATENSALVLPFRRKSWEIKPISLVEGAVRERDDTDCAWARTAPRERAAAIKSLSIACLTKLVVFYLRGFTGIAQGLSGGPSIPPTSSPPLLKRFFS